MKHFIKYFLPGLVVLFVLAGLIFYNNMLHTACVVSLMLALVAGGLFTLSLNRRYISKLEQQEEMRKRLTADVAHELRTPITAISANLEAFAEGALEPTPQRLRGCYDDIQRLSKLVADMESLAKAESDVLGMEMGPVDLLEAARCVFGTAGGEPVVVPGDRGRIAQVLENLRSNAEKYGGGEIIVTVRERGKYGEVVVSDNGAGIPPEDLPHIFERFYRADKSRNRSLGGAGIGLAVVKRIAEAHGGGVSAVSEPGKGSEFTVRFRK
ncbi:MAG: HAMP domain-containing histidine kinase [Lachnospiraceae bacterium]|nr:HAMP domain-containing histidine kinase [Lachnospiraceae bacterium]